MSDETERIEITDRAGRIVAHAVVDSDIAASLRGYIWRGCRSTSGKVYARRSFMLGPQRQQFVWMHREVMGLGPRSSGSSVEIDHVNLDTLDNRRRNLRVVSSVQNQQNKPSSKTSTSRYRGVSFEKRTGKWRAEVEHAGRRHFIGRFDDEEAAAVAASRLRQKIMPFSFEEVA